MNYTLTVPMTAPASGQGCWFGSSNEAHWFPARPSAFGGLKDGDDVTVTCSFDLTPQSNNSPAYWAYRGLTVGSCPVADRERCGQLSVAAAEISATGGLISGGHITQAVAPTGQDIFYNALGLQTPTIPLGRERGTIGSIYYQWTMTYNGANDLVADGNKVEIVFGFGSGKSTDV